jgi:FtsZ-interacting cell division protein ZipA
MTIETIILGGVALIIILGFVLAMHWRRREAEKARQRDAYVSKEIEYQKSHDQALLDNAKKRVSKYHENRNQRVPDPVEIDPKPRQSGPHTPSTPPSRPKFGRQRPDGYRPKNDFRQ